MPRNFYIKTLKFFLLTAILSFIMGQLCYADKGVFNSKVSTSEVFTKDMPSIITVTSEIGDIPMNDVKVSIYETTNEGQRVKPLCDMHIDKSLFVGQFNINYDHESTIYFKIIATYNLNETFESDILKVSIFEPLPEGLRAKMQKDLKDLENKFKEYLKTHNLSTSRRLTLEDARKNPNIISATLGGGNLGILYKHNIRGIVWLDDISNGPVDGLK